jgi:hypothetical protein
MIAAVSTVSTAKERTTATAASTTMYLHVHFCLWFNLRFNLLPQVLLFVDSLCLIVVFEVAAYIKLRFSFSMVSPTSVPTRSVACSPQAVRRQFC